MEHPGFKSYVQQEVRLRVSDRVAVDLQLEVGDMKETVSVNAAAPLLETTNASLGSVMDSRRIQDLPLSDGNPFILAHLAPGVLNLSNQRSQRTFDNDSTSDISSNGVITRRNEFQLDGVPDTAGRIVAFIPSTDMVREFKVQTARVTATPPAPLSMSASKRAPISCTARSGRICAFRHGCKLLLHQSRGTGQTGIPLQPLRRLDRRAGVVAKSVRRTQPHLLLLRL